MKRRTSPLVPETADLTMDRLVDAISQTHRYFSIQAGKAVNVSLTLRNWMMGCFIQEYEQYGADRAQYGEALLARLAEALAQNGMTQVAERDLRRFRQFYRTYPGIRQSLTAELQQALPPSRIRQSVTAESDNADLLEKLSFTHFVELIQIDDAEKRAFYEAECTRGVWSVRELKRQIASLYYERSALSRDKKKLAAQTQSAVSPAPAFPIRDPYVFEFLGLKPQEVMGESQLEDQLLDHLQNFLLELGHGFCFEARQKRLLIGETHGFVDLVFYHRILKCHVLVELKLQAFSHEAVGQLNTYVTWYARHMMSEGDNPPIGILLCTEKDHALVDYAMAGMDNQLFVSRYQLELPSKEVLQRFLEDHLKDA
ncbi:PDDEXK nuclease domain-containing protein [Propionivibrio soli]|uniref:PDDEXK nuclease domain-containing protein n=1 Tax=Propionivibrio soli TaxID=2976531 RepID=UPI0021E89669|nr:PDDEXK nuclease domain-containing protein [Propionivibrio soli]